MICAEHLFNIKSEYKMYYVAEDDVELRILSPRPLLRMFATIQQVFTTEM